MASNTISMFIPETCEAIIQEYSDGHMKCPLTPDEWKQVAEKFSSLWNFHNCIGAIDGKHIAIRKPKQSGTQFLKGFFSIVLMAVPGADCRFLFVDIGANGSCANLGIFKLTNIYKAIIDGDAGLPYYPAYNTHFYTLQNLR